MNEELQKLENLLLAHLPYTISERNEEKEAQEYFGCNFQMDNQHFKFRKAKITPKKVGQFVTLWKRNANRETEPFGALDQLDYCIVVTEEKENYGLFLFPKSELIKRQIVSTPSKAGKRGFRVYPSWIQTENKQAEKTQLWQNLYFIDVTQENTRATEKVKAILNSILR